MDHDSRRLIGAVEETKRAKAAQDREECASGAMTTGASIADRSLPALARWKITRDARSLACAPSWWRGGGFSSFARRLIRTGRWQDDESALPAGRAAFVRRWRRALSRAGGAPLDGEWAAPVDKGGVDCFRASDAAGSTPDSRVKLRLTRSIGLPWRVPVKARQSLVCIAVRPVWLWPPAVKL